jgi:hypothetical protein
MPNCTVKTTDHGGQAGTDKTSDSGTASNAGSAAGKGAGSGAGSGGNAGAAGRASNVGDDVDSGTSTTGGSSDTKESVIGPDGLYRCADLAKLGTAKTIQGLIQEAQTWSGVLRVTGGITTWKDITIEPGTVIIANANTSIAFGDDGAGKAPILHADGTAEKPIRFCGATSQPGFWAGIRLFVEKQSSLQHVLISDAGANGSALTVDGPASLVDVQLRNSGGDGLTASAIGPNSSGLVVEGATGNAVVLKSPQAVDAFPTTSKFIANKLNRAMLTFDIVDKSTTFANLGIPYYQKSPGMRYQADAVITFAAGVEYRFSSTASIDIGWNNSNPELQLNGTEAAPIVFRGDEDQKGFWNGILIEGAIKPASSLNYVRIQHAGGSNTPPLKLLTPVTLNNVTLQANKGPADFRVAPTNGSQKLIISGSDGSPLQIELATLPSLPKDSVFTGNATDVIELLTSSRIAGTVTIANPGVPFLLKGNAIFAGNDVTLAAGVRVLVAAGVGVTVGENYQPGKLSTAGTADQPVIFRGKEDTKGFWKGIRYQSYADAASKLDHVELHGAGVTTYAPITITNSSFSGSPGFGIARPASITSDYTATNTFSDNTSGDVGAP